MHSQGAASSSTRIDTGTPGRRRVLFVCTGNATRSQMAEAWLRRYGGEQFEVQSAGIEPREAVDALAVAAMAECGVDMAEQHPKDVWHFVDQPWDFVITTCDRANETCPRFPGPHEPIHWRFQDPATAQGSQEERLRIYRRVRDEILTRVRLFVGVHTRARI